MPHIRELQELAECGDRSEAEAEWAFLAKPFEK